MTFTNTKLSLAVAAIGACLAAPLAVHAADAAKPMVAGDGAYATNRAHMKAWNDEKGMLQNDLAVGHDKAWYAKAIADKGFQITSVNVDKPTELEYEIVKGRQSYEVQIDFDKANGMAKKVDVKTNMWRADATKQAMAGNKVPVATAYTKGNENFSDRGYMKGWSGEKEKLEKQLSVGQERGFYLAELKKMGYQVTATNDNEKDYVEYEVVKGKNNFEVQIDFENGKSKKVDVTTNMWNAEGTDKVVDSKKR